MKLSLWSLVLALSHRIASYARMLYALNALLGIIYQIYLSASLALLIACHVQIKVPVIFVIVNSTYKLITHAMPVKANVKSVQYLKINLPA